MTLAVGWSEVGFVRLLGLCQLSDQVRQKHELLRRHAGRFNLEPPTIMQVESVIHVCWLAPVAQIVVLQSHIVL